MTGERFPTFAAVVVLGGGALVCAIIGTPLSGILIMLAAAASAVIAIAAGQRGATAEAAPAPANIVSAALHQHDDFTQLIDVLDFPILVEGNGRVLAANARAKSVLGHFIVGADVRAAIRHPVAGDLVSQPERHVSAAPVDLIGIGAPGERWQMRVMPIANDTKLITLNDQTAHDAIERMRADFVANASHELRTPLAVILGSVETLRDPDAANDHAVRAKFLDNTEREGRRMLRLVEDLLSISRIEASKSQRPTDAVDMTQLCRTVIAELGSAGAGDATQINLEARGQTIVRGDRAQLSQLVHNLVSNAIKYGGDRGPVSVSLSHPTSDMAELRVTDSGEGIAPEHLPRLTERFYRVDTARSRAKGGTGLGLAIAKHIVQRHQGRLEIDSTIGVGTSVRVRLPIVDDAAG